MFSRKRKNLRLNPSEDLFFREHHDFFTNIKKFETDSKWRNLKKTYSGVGVGLRKNIFFRSRNRSRSTEVPLLSDPVQIIQHRHRHLLLFLCSRFAGVQMTRFKPL